MKVVVAGASGFIGTALTAHLRDCGHEVLRLVRRHPEADDEVRWDPVNRCVDAHRLAGVQAGVNLAGAPLAGRRWNEAYKSEIRTSRTDATRTLAEALVEVGAKTLVQGSAIGFYGQHHTDDLIEESSPAGTDFLADVCADWERAADAAVQAGIRVATIRTGLVMGDGGAFAPLLLPLRFGLGGPIGAGRAWWSWITMPDTGAAIEFLLREPISGPVNLTGPEPVPNRRVTAALAGALHRPAVLPVPPVVLRVALGEFADEIQASRRVLPSVLLESGFTFTHPTVDDAAAWLARTVR